MKFLYLVPLPLIGAAFMRYYEDHDRRDIALGIKAVSSAVFILIGILSFRLSSRGTAALLLLLGLIAGWFGDMLLKWVYIGGTCFLAGHIFYLISVVPRVNGSVFPPILLAVCAAGICSVLIYSHYKEKPTVFKILSTIYLIFVISVATFGIALYATGLKTVSSKPAALSNTLFMIGGICFAASDVIIVINMNRKEKSPRLDDVLIYLYYLGQCLIALSIQGL